MVSIFKRKPRPKSTDTPPGITSGNGGSAGPYREEPPEQQIHRLREQVADLQAKLSKSHEPGLDLARQLAESQAAVEHLGKERGRYSRQATEYRNASVKANTSLRAAERRISQMQGSQGPIELLGMELHDVPKGHKLFVDGQCDLLDSLLVFLRTPMGPADLAVWDAYVAGALWATAALRRPSAGRTRRSSSGPSWCKSRPSTSPRTTFPNPTTWSTKARCAPGATR